MSFCTTINCMDGRVQLPVINYLMTRCGVSYVDSITEPGPIAILAEEANIGAIASIMERVEISVRKHGSRAIAIVGHYDCAGNPVDQATQEGQTRASMELVKSRFPDCEVFGLWVDEQWEVSELEAE